MTILAYASEHLVEYTRAGGGLLTIARHGDGHCKGLTGKGIAGQFRDCLKTHPPGKVIDIFLKMVRGGEWRPPYVADGTHKVAALYDVKIKD